VPIGSQVTLQASGAGFQGWRGPVGTECGTASTCTFVAAMPPGAGTYSTVYADFAPATTHTIAVTIVGSGEVTTYTPGNDSQLGIDCTASCTMVVPDAATVSLLAATSRTFAGWSGSCSGTDPSSCTVDSHGDRAITATFVDDPGATVHVDDVPRGTLATNVVELDGGGDLFVSTEPYVSRISAAGATIWSVPHYYVDHVLDLKSDGAGSLYMLAERAYGTLPEQVVVYKLDAATGAIAWLRELAGPPCGVLPNNVYVWSGYFRHDLDVITGAVAVVANNTLHVLAATDGSETWNAVVPGCRGVVATPGGGLAVQTTGSVANASVIRTYSANGTAGNSDIVVPGLGVASLAVAPNGDFITHANYNGTSTITRFRSVGSTIFSTQEVTDPNAVTGVAAAASGTAVVVIAPQWQNPGATRIEYFNATGAKTTYAVKPTGEDNGAYPIDVAADPSGRVVVAGPIAMPFRIRSWIESITPP
jgi:hypothetical protein